MQSEKYQWKKRVDEALLQLNKTPLLPRFSFDWVKLKEKLTSHFAEKKISFKIKESIWRSQEKIKEGFSENTIIQGLILTPVEGNLFWIMDKKDVFTLVSHMLIEPPVVDLSSEPLQEGFYHYLCLLSLEYIQSMEELQPFNIKLIENSYLEEKEYLCRDVAIKLNKTSVWGRLAIAPSFLDSFNQKLKERPSLYEKEWQQNIDLTLKIEGGKTFLLYEQLKQLKKGDFVLFDRCGYDPHTQKGLVTIVLEKTPLLHAKIKNEKIKILDYAFYYEDKPMEKEEKEEISELEELEEESLPTEKKSMEKEKISAIKKTEICLTAEIARLNMTVEKLMKLQPGNFLEISIFPEDQVNLTINGKVVGRGEIIHLGEALGIRILEIHQ